MSKRLIDVTTNRKYVFGGGTLNFVCELIFKKIPFFFHIISLMLFVDTSSQNV